jgi:hypothetical protein
VNQHVDFGIWMLVTAVEMLMGRRKYVEMSLARTSSLFVAYPRSWTLLSEFLRRIGKAITTVESAWATKVPGRSCYVLPMTASHSNNPST